MVKTQIRRQQSSAPAMVLMPPAWTARIGLGLAGAGLAYGLLRAAGGWGEGLGYAPFAAVALGAGLYLLLTGKDRIEIDEQRITRYRGARITARHAARDVAEVRMSGLAKALVFRRGAVLRIPLHWDGADVVAAFFQRRLEQQELRRADAAVDAGERSRARAALARPAAGAARGRLMR